MCGTLVYSRGDEVQSKRDHQEYEAHAAEEGEAQPPVLMPGEPPSIGLPLCACALVLGQSCVPWRACHTCHMS